MQIQGPEDTDSGERRGHILKRRVCRFIGEDDAEISGEEDADSEVRRIRFRGEEISDSCVRRM
jgi:hypothetical protein